LLPAFFYAWAPLITVSFEHIADERRYGIFLRDFSFLIKTAECRRTATVTRMTSAADEVNFWAQIGSVEGKCERDHKVDVSVGLHFLHGRLCSVGHSL
jgi:hypothetical protein